MTRATCQMTIDSCKQALREHDAETKNFKAANDQLKTVIDDLELDNEHAEIIIETLKAQNAELKRWQEFVRYNSKEAAHMADEAMKRKKDELA